MPATPRNAAMIGSKKNPARMRRVSPKALNPAINFLIDLVVQ